MIEMTLRDAKRICAAHGTCSECPLYCMEKAHCVLYGNTPMGYDITGIQKSCSTWLKEHPGPIYPTYYNWMTSEGVYDFGERISPEFAEKYGIKPLNE